MIARSALAAVLLAQLLLGTDCALVGWWAFDAEGGDSCPDRAGGPAAPLDLTGGAVVSLGDSNETHALRLWGNATSGTAFEVPHHSKIDDMEEFTLSLWLNWWWGGSTLVSKDNGWMLEIYRGFLKTNAVNTNGSVEWTPYPLGCGYVQPGQWIHVALSYTRDGRMHLYMHGKECVSNNSFWRDMAAMSGKNGPDYSTPPGPLAPGSKNISIGGWSGLVSDVRLYDARLDAAALAELHKSTAHIYNSTALQVPSAAEIKQLNKTWRPPVIGPPVMTMYNAWLNHNSSSSSSSSSLSQAEDSASEWTVPRWLQKVVVASSDGGIHGDHPAIDTAARELQAVLPTGDGGDVQIVNAAAADGVDSVLALADNSILIGTCDDLESILPLLPPSGAARQLCSGQDKHTAAAAVAAEEEGREESTSTIHEDGYALELYHPAEQHGTSGHDGSAIRLPFLVAVGGGAPGVLYAAFAVVEHVQLQKGWSAAAVSRGPEVPVTKIRCINHWSQWRGLPWCGQHAFCWRTFP
jgi:hypothetical protein